KTISEVFEDTVGKFPGQEAIVVRHQEVRYTWAQLAAEVDKTARGLRGLGLERGDRVGVWATNCVEWFLLQLATARARVVLVNVNPAYRSHELRYVLRQSGIKALFLRESDARANYLQILAESRDGEPLPLRDVVLLGGESWRRMIDGGVDFEAGPSDPQDVANIQYTSGTTGSPKGVLLTHRNLVNNGNGIAWCLKASNQDRICSPVPFYHCFGCVIGSMVSITSGATLLVPAAQFDAEATMRAIEEERATAIYGVPTMFIAELEHPGFGRFDFSSVRTGVMAGSPCPIKVMKRVMNEMHCPEITICYGQTELSPVVTMSRVDDSMELRVQTIGCAMPNTEIKVISTETGETVEAGQPGELCARGYMVMKGYDGLEEATRQALSEDGWLRTGDLAIMQENGYFRIRGRAKDTIIRGGENIYPREIEEFLHTHPKVADVYVVGLPDERLGETVCAWIKLKQGVTATEEEFRQYGKGQVAYFKIPQYIRFVESFPMTITSKVQKYLIREQEIRDRGLQHAATIETA
ncbi:MAG: AMP-binding protein, partial [Acidobacteria bacterium]|nr:AMP-binding protein [Acidobacteriota bacterium]